MGKEDRGFASMDPIKQKEIARKGGRAAHLRGTAHEWSSEEAREAGRKGGIASHQMHRHRTAQESVPQEQHVDVLQDQHVEAMNPDTAQHPDSPSRF
jgi:general stress protein YciG